MRSKFFPEFLLSTGYANDFVKLWSTKHLRFELSTQYTYEYYMPFSETFRQTLATTGLQVLPVSLFLSDKGKEKEKNLAACVPTSLQMSLKGESSAALGT